MEVLHDTTYMVTGDLRIDPTTPVDFEEGFIIGAAATTDGGPCDDGLCNTHIDGSFFGPPAGTGVNAAPVLAGLDYEIITIPFDPDTLTGKSIIGNAIFKRDGATTPIPDTFTVMPDQGLVLVLPNPNPDPLFPDEFADIGLFYDATNIVGDDRLNRRGLVTTAGFEIDDDSGEEFFVVATIDPAGTLAVIDQDPNVVAAQGLIADALVSDPGLFADVVASPATLAEYFPGNGIAWGRWAGDGGNILVVDVDIVAGSPGVNKTVEKLTFTGKQSLAFVTGDAPATPLQGATGTYQFIGGTQSTTASGATIGQGVTSGELIFDFGSTPIGTVAMTVNHLTDYNVTGFLEIDDTNPRLFFDTDATAITTGGNCDTGCTTFIDGGFAGALSGGLAVHRHMPDSNTTSRTRLTGFWVSPHSNAQAMHNSDTDIKRQGNDTDKPGPGRVCFFSSPRTTTGIVL